MNAMKEMQLQLEIQAQQIYDYDRDVRDPAVITRWADRICEIDREIEAGDYSNSYERECLMACMMLKFWDKCRWLYEQTKTSGLYEYEDMPSKIYERINYALGYEAWKKLDPATGKPKTNAMACINQAIATEKLNILGYSSDDHHKANCPVYSTSADGCYADDGDTPLIATFSSPDEDSYYIELDNSLTVQSAIDSKHVVEAIVMVAAQTDDCRKHIANKKSFTVVDESTGEEREEEAKTDSQEFWERKLVNVLAESVEKRWFRDLILSKFSIAEDVLDRCLDRIKTANRRDQYSFVRAAQKLVLRGEK